MAGTVKFFDPSDPLSLTDWEIQKGGNPSLVKQRAQALDKNGDEFRRQQYGGQTSVTLDYICKKVSGYADVPEVGSVVGGWHVDSWTVTYTQQNWPTLSVSCHKHDTSKGGVVDADCRTYAPSFKIPVAWGVPTELPKATSGNVFELSSGAVVTTRGMTLSMQVNHVDEADNAGEHFAGDNYDGSETLNVDFTGDVDPATDYTLDSDWTDDTFSKDQGNTQATTSSLSASHHVGHTVAVPSGT